MKRPVISEAIAICWIGFNSDKKKSFVCICVCACSERQTMGPIHTQSATMMFAYIGHATSLSLSLLLLLLLKQFENEELG